jgi:hypothetical protein
MAPKSVRKSCQISITATMPEEEAVGVIGSENRVRSCSPDAFGKTGRDQGDQIGRILFSLGEFCFLWANFVFFERILFSLSYCFVWAVF